MVSPELEGEPYIIFINNSSPLYKSDNMTLHDIFSDFMEAKSLFQNRDVLSISFTPESIPHREKQINDLGKILAPSLLGAKPSNVFIYGRTGTGKSLVSLYVTSELMKTIKEKQKDMKLRTIYINCKMKKTADTEYRLIATIAKEFGKEEYMFDWDEVLENNERFASFLKQNFSVEWAKAAKFERVGDDTIKISAEKNSMLLKINSEKTKLNITINEDRASEFIIKSKNNKLSVYKLGKDEIPFTGLPTEQVYRKFFERIDNEKQTIILIIDEIDALVEKTGDEILYNLTRVNQDLKNAKLCIIGITNNLSFIDNLDPRVKSSLSEEELVFPPYNAVQLKDILRERAERAFSKESLDNGVIEKCAALAAQEHGDARRALDLLRVAGELAERSGSAKIGLQHVDTAEEKIDTDKFVEIIKIQPKQSQLVLYTILNLTNGKEEAMTNDVLTAYQENCRKFSLKALTQRRVSDLIAELDLFGVINTKTVSRGRYGRTRVITVSLSEGVKEKVNKTLNEVFY